VVSPPIGVEDLGDLPDHTEQLEELNSKSSVDGVLPRHLGNCELGRFVPGFTIVSDRTVQFRCLNFSNGTFSFEKMYEFNAEQDVEIWDSLWEGNIVFHWADHDDALTIRGYELAYISRFTLDRPVPEVEDMTAWAKENLNITSEPELPECSHGHQGRLEPVSQLPLRVASCTECGMPIRVEYESSTVGSWESFLIEPWWEFSESTVIDRGDTYLVDKRGRDTPVTLTDVAVHLMSRSAHVEYEPFDHYLGDYNTVAVVCDGDFAGYLTWNKVCGRTVLHCVYVRPEFRDKGLAADLVSMWYDEVCPTESYYANEPNESGLAVLKSVGHLGDDGVASPVRIH